MASREIRMPKTRMEQISIAPVKKRVEFSFVSCVDHKNGLDGQSSKDQLNFFLSFSTISFVHRPSAPPLIDTRSPDHKGKGTPKVAPSSCIGASLPSFIETRQFQLQPAGSRQTQRMLNSGPSLFLPFSPPPFAHFSHWPHAPHPT